MLSVLQINSLTLLIFLLYIFVFLFFFLHLLVRELIPRQVDKKSRVPKEEKGIWGSQGGDRDLEFSRKRTGQKDIFFLHSLVRVI